MTDKVQLTDLQAMKRDGRKIVGVVAWDYQMARIVDRAGVDLVSVGDTVGINLWGQPNPLEVTMDQMIVVCQAVRRGVKRALVSCDFPFGPVQEGPKSAVRAAIRFVKEAGVDMVKLDGASEHLDAVTAVTRAGIPVFAQFGITPQTSLKYGVTYSAITEARRCRSPMRCSMKSSERQSVSRMRAPRCSTSPTPGPPSAPPSPRRCRFRWSVASAAGRGWTAGCGWSTAAIGYSADALDIPPDTYANVARIAHDAIVAYADDVRSSRQIAGGLRR